MRLQLPSSVIRWRAHRFVRGVGLGALVCLGVPDAGQAQDLTTSWQSAVYSGSDRLLAFSVLNHSRPAGAEAFLQGVAVRDGQAHQPGQWPQMVSGSFSLAPIVGYDPNLNSGVHAKTIGIGGDVMFTVDEDSRAKAGFTIGAKLTSRHAWSVAKGQVLTFDSELAYSFAPQHGLDTKTAYAKICLDSHVAGWTWLSSCAGGAYVEKTTEVREAFLETSATQIFTSGRADHLVRVSLRQTYRSEYEKTTVSLKSVNAIPRLGSLGFEVSYGENVPGHNTTRYGVSAWLSRPIAGRVTSLSAAWSQTGGGSFFGTKQRDNNYSISIGRQLTDQFSASIGYAWTNSSVSAFDTGSVQFGIGIKGVSF
ncbi:MAG: hypothetical protein ACRBBU_04620 [Pseudooceanicola sp.]